MSIFQICSFVVYSIEDKVYLEIEYKSRGTGENAFKITKSVIPNGG